VASPARGTGARQHASYTKTWRRSFFSACDASCLGDGALCAWGTPLFRYASGVSGEASPRTLALFGVAGAGGEARPCAGSVLIASQGTSSAGSASTAPPANCTCTLVKVVATTRPLAPSGSLP